MKNNTSFVSGLKEIIKQKKFELALGRSCTKELKKKGLFEVIRQKKWYTPIVADYVKDSLEDVKTYGQEKFFVFCKLAIRNVEKQDIITVLDSISSNQAKFLSQYEELLYSKNVRGYIKESSTTLRGYATEVFGVACKLACTQVEIKEVNEVVKNITASQAKVLLNDKTLLQDKDVQAYIKESGESIRGYGPAIFNVACELAFELIEVQEVNELIKNMSEDQAKVLVKNELILKDKNVHNYIKEENDIIKGYGADVFMLTCELAYKKWGKEIINAIARNITPDQASGFLKRKLANQREIVEFLMQDRSNVALKTNLYLICEKGFTQEEAEKINITALNEGYESLIASAETEQEKENIEKLDIKDALLQIYEKKFEMTGEQRKALQKKLNSGSKDDIANILNVLPILSVEHASELFGNQRLMNSGSVWAYMASPMYMGCCYNTYQFILACMLAQNGMEPEKIDESAAKLTPDQMETIIENDLTNHKGILNILNQDFSTENMNFGSIIQDTIDEALKHVHTSSSNPWGIESGYNHMNYISDSTSTPTSHETPTHHDHSTYDSSSHDYSSSDSSSFDF